MSKIYEEQPLLMELPAVLLAPIPSTGLTLSPPAVSTTALGALASLFTVIEDAVPGVVLVDPRAVTVDPVNTRAGVAFDPGARGELIVSMHANGNTVPVRLRRDPAGGPGLLCFSGSQRLGAALHIQQDYPGFRLRAIISEVTTDQEAFAIGEADNAGRTDIAPMQQARAWARTLTGAYAGDRAAFITATGRTASVVSRTLALLTLPDYVLAVCSDVETLNPYFAERIVPRLGDPAEEPSIRRRADALATAGQSLPAARLIRALLEDAPAPKPAPVTIWQGGSGNRVAFTPDGRGGGVARFSTQGLDAKQRRELKRAVAAFIDTLSPVLTGQELGS